MTAGWLLDVARWLMTCGWPVGDPQMAVSIESYQAAGPNCPFCEAESASAPVGTKGRKVTRA